MINQNHINSFIDELEKVSAELRGNLPQRPIAYETAGGFTMRPGVGGTNTVVSQNASVPISADQQQNLRLKRALANYDSAMPKFTPFSEQAPAVAPARPQTRPIVRTPQISPSFGTSPREVVRAPTRPIEPVATPSSQTVRNATTAVRDAVGRVGEVGATPRISRPSAPQPVSEPITRPATNAGRFMSGLAGAGIGYASAAEHAPLAWGNVKYMAEKPSRLIRALSVPNAVSNYARDFGRDFDRSITRLPAAVVDAFAGTTSLSD